MKQPASVRYREQALAWQSAFDAHYADPDTGAYYLSADDASDLLLRPHSTSDDATPNPNAVAAQNLVRLAVLAGDDKWRTKADRLVEGILSAAERNLFGHVALLNALDLRLRGAEIVATGPDAERFVRAALKLPYLDRIVLRVTSARRPAGRTPRAGKAEGRAGQAQPSYASVRLVHCRLRIQLRSLHHSRHCALLDDGPNDCRTLRVSAHPFG